VDPGFGDLFDPQAQVPIIPPMRPIRMGGLAGSDRQAGPPFGLPIGLLEMLDPRPHLGWLHDLFDGISYINCLSSVRSATFRLSCRFSSSKCLIRRSSETPYPPHFFFQREKASLEIPSFGRPRPPGFRPWLGGARRRSVHRRYPTSFIRTFSSP
jgi:hypothetical protein